MPFRLLGYELKKLLEQPMILIFLICTLLLNTGTVLTAGLEKNYLNFVNEVKTVTGEKITEDFQNQLADFSERPSFQRLKSESEEANNVFSDYQTAELSDEVIYMFGLEGTLAEKMTKKYAKLQPVVAALAKEESALELAAAGDTMSFFTFVRNLLLPLLLMEGIIFGGLIGLYSSTSERFTKTDSLVFITKTGRKLQFHKYLISLTLVLGYFLLNVVFTFALSELTKPLGSLWQNSVSTYFHKNVYIPLNFEIPFITWTPLTLVQHTLLTILVSVLLVIFTHGFGFILGLWLTEFFRGFIALISLVILLKGILQVASGTFIWSTMMWTPLALVENQSYWFTEMAHYATIPWQESVGACLNLGILLAAGLLSVKYYPTKELT